MRITYDPAVDALAIRFRNRTGGRLDTIVVRPGVHVDIDAAGHVAAIEILDASDHISAEELATIGAPSQLLSLAELEARFGVSAATWKKLCQAKRVRAVKRGRDWAVELVDALAYLESRAPSGRPARKRRARRRAGAR